MVSNQSYNDRLIKVLSEFKSFIPGFISECVVSRDFLAEDEYVDRIAKILRYNFWYVDDIINFYEWIGVSTKVIEGAGKTLFGNAGWISFREFIDIYEKDRLAQEIVSKLIVDLEDVIQGATIDDLIRHQFGI